MNNSLTLTLPISSSQRVAMEKRKNLLTVFWILIISLLAFSIVLYVFQVNELTKEIYLIQNYERKLDKLSKENKNAEIGFSTVNSLEKIEGDIQNLNLEKLTEIKYIRILDGQVVKTTQKVVGP